MAAQPDIPPVLGDPRPRFLSVPESCSDEHSEGAIELAASAGLFLDEWQQWGLRQSMGIRRDGKWAAKDVCWIISRQNGKNGMLLARELYGMFVLGEDLLIHTAHEFKASNEHFRRLMLLIKNTPSLHKRVKPRGYKTSHGSEGIELKAKPTLVFGAGGKLVTRPVEPRLAFIARSRGSGRSFTCDCLVYDEAMFLTEEQVGASMPTLSAVPNPQVWYTASAGLPDSTQLSAVRQRGLAGTDPALTFGEWSCELHNDYCAPGCTEHDEPADVRSWAKANPGLGIRLSLEWTQHEFTTMPAAKFNRERLGVGEWPAGSANWLVIPEAVWDRCQVAESIERPRRVALAVDVTPDQSAACIVIGSVARHEGRERILVERGRTAQGWEDHRAGTEWIVPRLKELKLNHGGRIAAIVIDPVGPGAPLIIEAEKAGLEVTALTARDVAQAHLQFCNWCRDIPAEGDKPAEPRKLAHLGQADLRSAVAAGVRREIGDGQYAWARRNTASDISPLCGATMAAWAANKFGRGYDVLKSVAGI